MSATRPLSGSGTACRTRSRSAYVPVRSRNQRLQLESFDQQYVSALVAGDAEVEKHFTGYFADLMLIKLRQRVRTAEQREDIIQETFLRVISFLKKNGGLEHPDRLGAFVNTVCTNILMEQYRKSARIGELPERLEDPPDHRADAEQAMVTEERKNQVRNVLADMPARDRDLLRALFLEERDKDEICRTMNVDRDYLRVLLHRAKARFREASGKSLRHPAAPVSAADAVPA